MMLKPLKKMFMPLNAVLFLGALIVIPETAWGLPLDLISKYSKEYGLDKNWVAAIAMKESKGVEFSSRYEPSYTDLWFYRQNAERLEISQATERTHQKTSWGIMQVMGSTARELQFKGMLPALGGNALSLKYGCKYLKMQLVRYGTYRLAVAAYNRGSIIKTKGGLLVNEKYIDDVSRNYREFTKYDN